MFQHDVSSEFRSIYKLKSYELCSCKQGYGWLVRHDCQLLRHMNYNISGVENGI